MKISPATSIYPGKTIQMAIINILKQPLIKDKPFENDVWDFSHIQICPQHIGYLTKKQLEKIQENHLNTKFRLHANVRVQNELIFFDASDNLKDKKEYIEKLKALIMTLKNDIYTYHAPQRKMISWEEIKKNVLSLQDYFNIQVGIEGLYPVEKFQDIWSNSLLGYEQLMNSGLFFVVDLSHLNILYHYQKNDLEDIKNLTKELLNHQNCIEVHISGNNGKYDQHHIIEDKNIWWLDILKNSKYQKTIFCESKQN